MKFSHAEKLRTVDRTIQDKQLQVTEANKSLATIKKDAEEENNEIDTQKAQKKTSLEQQMANIAERLLSLQKETADAVKASDEKIALLNLELNDLKAGALANDVGEPGSQFLFDNIANQANTNLSIITSASSGAYGACCSGKASKQGAEGSGANCLSLNGENAAAAKKSKSKDRTNN